MIATIMLGVFSILFAYIARYKKTQWGLKFSFFLIFIFLALRYDFGNDYETYLNNFNSIKNSAFSDINEYFLIEEPAWLILNWIFKDLGFFALTATIGLFSCVIYYQILKKYVNVKYYWLAIFLYIFNPVLMVINTSAMRQSIAVLLFLYSIKFIEKKESIKYIICITLASLFHYTAIILLPVFLIIYLNKKIGLKSATFLIIIYTIPFLFSATLAPYLKVAITFISEKYAYYEDAGVTNSGLGFIYYSILFIYTLYCEKFQSRKIALIFKLSIIGFLIIPLSLLVAMSGRVGIYFAPAIMVVYPALIEQIKNKNTKIIVGLFLIIITLFQFIQFFYSDNYKEYFGIYKTIFSAPSWY
jgi:hypothetical protein